MAIEGNEAVKQYLDTLARGFSCHHFDGAAELLIGTPYLYPNDDCICLYLKELADGRVRVSDGGEAAHLNLWKSGVDIFRSPRAIALARDIARDNMAEFELGTLTRTGSLDDLGDMMLGVIQAAYGVANLRYFQPNAYLDAADFKKPAKSLFSEKLSSLLAEIAVTFEPSAKLTGSSGQIYTVDCKITGRAGNCTYLHTLNISRSSNAKSHVDRLYRIWADCNESLSIEQKITLLNDEEFQWKDSHVNLLGSVSTVINWSERDKLVELVCSLN